MGFVFHLSGKLGESLMCCSIRSFFSSLKRLPYNILNFALNEGFCTSFSPLFMLEQRREQLLTVSTGIKQVDEAISVERIMRIDV